MKDTRIQWHPGFVAAMGLEFIQDKDGLTFLKEYNLNTKPLEIDLLVIQKCPGIAISNEIGGIFRGHNIMEYKSPGDRLDIDVFYKAMAYACLYKSYGETLDARKADDITISLVRDERPLGLFRYLLAHGCSLSQPYSGIYYIEGGFPFPSQVIATKELMPEAHAWLRALSRDVQREEALNLLGRFRSLEGMHEQELASSVLTVMAQANRQIIQNQKGDDGMFEALMELFEPEITLMVEEARKETWKEARKETWKECKKEDIQNTVDILRDFGHVDGDIKAAIIKKYDISADEAEGYL